MTPGFPGTSSPPWVSNAAGHVLLVEGDRRGWEPPGGQLEFAEDLAAALKREVDRLVDVYSNLGRSERGVPEQLNFAFSCHWISGEPRAGGECLHAGWFPANEALELVDAPQQIGKLRDALVASHGVAYRSYRTYQYEVLYERVR